MLFVSELFFFNTFDYFFKSEVFSDSQSRKSSHHIVCRGKEHNDLRIGKYKYFYEADTKNHICKYCYDKSICKIIFIFSKLFRYDDIYESLRNYYKQDNIYRITEVYIKYRIFKQQIHDSSKYYYIYNYYKTNLWCI